MTTRIIIGTLFLALLLAVSASAQQSPLDQGEADSLWITIIPPVIGEDDSTAYAELWAYHDVQNITNLSSAFSWDNPKFQMDSAWFDLPALMAFNFIQFLYYQGDSYPNLINTNANQRFQCVGGRISGAGMVASPTPQLIATFRFKIENYTPADQLCISLETFNAFLFVDLASIEYPPIWRGNPCLIELGALETDVTELNFVGVEGNSLLPQQSFHVSEAGGGAIDFAASEVTISGLLFSHTPNGTTPQDVFVTVNASGLSAGDYTTEIEVTSPGAGNTVTVTINLHLDPPNQMPVIVVGAGGSVAEGELSTFTITVSDPDGPIPALTWAPLPGTATITDMGGGAYVFEWQTGFDDAGDYEFLLEATDGDLTAQVGASFVISNVNRAPVLDAIAAQSTLEGANLNFVASASDPDGELLTLSAELLPGTAGFTNNGDGTGTFNWTPGNTDAGNYTVRIIATDDNLADTAMVDIEVIDADGFVVDQSVLNFTADFGAGDPATQSINVSVSDGSTIAFDLAEAAAWFDVAPASGTTPQSFDVMVSLAGLTAGMYTDVVTISDPASGLDPIDVTVNLTVRNNLVVPAPVDLTMSEGDLLPLQFAFPVEELGGDIIEFNAVASDGWFTVNPDIGTTPDVVTITIGTELAPGTYDGSVTIFAHAAFNAPVEVPVHLVVTPCPTFTVEEYVFSTEIFAGDFATINETITVTAADGEIDWVTVDPSGAYTLTPAAGNTGTDPQVGVAYSMMFDTEGMYSDTAIIVATDVPGEWACPDEVLIITNVTVYRPPSADTVIVVNTPALPGMRVEVPIIFSNSCPLREIGLSLDWYGGLHLDSVSFVGSALENIDDITVFIDNTLTYVTMVAKVGAQATVPVGSEQLAATMHFALSCEIEEGSFPFQLGSPDVMLPADVYFIRACPGGDDTEIPEYIQGNVIVGSASNFVCGYVVDPSDNEIEGATVELYENYPFTEPLMATTSSSIGSFAFDEIIPIPFDVYAYKEGYYPGKVENLNFGEKGFKVVLEPLPLVITETSFMNDYYCPDSSSTYLGAPLRAGAVVEAYTQHGLLVGQQMITTPGKYGFLHVYRAWPEQGELGAVAGDQISFFINSLPAMTSGATTYPEDWGGFVPVCLEVRGTVDKDCFLSEGWNLVSWNVDTESDDILTVLAPVMDYVDVVLGFGDGGETFVPSLQPFSDLWTVDHMSGYWIKISGTPGVMLTVSGLPVPETTPIALNAGWNLVSYLPEAGTTPDEGLAGVTDDGNLVFAYGFPDNNIRIYEAGSSFNNLTSMDPCNGYWLKMTSSDVLIYNQVPPPGAAPKAPVDRNRAVASLSSGVAPTNAWVSLYSRDLELDGSQVTTGTIIEAYSVERDELAGSFTMKEDGQFGFLSVYAEIANSGATGLKAGEEFYLTVNDVATNEVFTWSNNGDRMEIISLSTSSSVGAVLPKEYSLGQNYPNPFNPSTTISFSMEKAGHAQVEVFNVLGRSVGVLFDGQAEAGRNQVIWNGRDDSGNTVASGIYFYRLTADNFSETRKMMLLK